MRKESGEPLGVLIAGGGVAGLEAALALRDLAGDAVTTTLLAPGPDFVYRPMTVREPFGFSRAQRYPLHEICEDIGAEMVQDSFSRLDAERRIVHTESGRELSYGALLLALGARSVPRFDHATTLDDRRLDEQLHGLIQDLEAGYVRGIAFIEAAPMPWPLPIYEVALMTARRAYDMNVEVEITIVTPEEAPLAIFGTAVSEEMAKVLDDNGVRTITSSHAEVPDSRHVKIHPGGQTLDADRIVALPQLFGPEAPGVPSASPDGFIPVDEDCQVRGLDRVWAAGDATDFPIKLGGIAAQQADTAAAAIAALAGTAAEPQRFDPEVHAVLLGARKPLYLSGYMTGGHGETSRLSETPGWSPPTKIVARYLAPYLDTLDHVTGSPR